MKKYVYFSLILTVVSNALFAQQKITDRLILENQQQTNWWTGIINHGELMPFQNTYEANMYGNNYGNQIQPLLLFADGQYIWSEKPISISFHDGTLKVESYGGTIQYSDKTTSLREAYQKASQTFFPPSGKIPDLDLVRYPQYNTWIELMYDQNQKDILQYARDILNNGFPPGVIMVDDNWQEDYGAWSFHPGRIPDPKMMVDSLHQMGFKVMLWVCPFVSPDSYTYRYLRDNNLLLKDSSGHAAIIRWWNGASGLLDFTNPKTVDWFDQQLQMLVDTYGVDGFKLDGGDTRYYTNVVSHKQVTPNEHTRLYGLFGLEYPLNEYRAIWKMGGDPLVQRLRDKSHQWDDLQKLIPHILLQGIMGYPFTCPDMIGGGEYKSFLNAETIDQELIVRSAQCHALMPMMQFSVAPWRILDDKHLQACKKAVDLRQEHIETILELMNQSAVTGEPVVRSMEYVFPHKGYEKIQDQFMLGNDIMIAPVLGKGQASREVVIPKGTWIDQNGNRWKGPKKISVKVSLDDLPFFKQIH